MTCYNSPKVQILATACCTARYSLYLLYWYTSTNTDTLAAEPPAATPEGSEEVLEGDEKGALTLLALLALLVPKKKGEEKGTLTLLALLALLVHFIF